MEKKIRNITVDNKSFVWWYVSGHKYILNISPKEDKTTKISIIFEATEPEDINTYSNGFFEVSCLKDNLEMRLHLAGPKFVSEAIAYCISNNNFIKNKINPMNGVELLKIMGYSNIKPIWNWYLPIKQFTDYESEIL